MTAIENSNEADPVKVVDFAEHITRIVCAYLGHNQVAVEKIPEVIQTVTLAMQGKSTVPVKIGIASPDNPAVPIKKSIGPDFIICLEDGKKLTMLKRYLMSQFGMTPEEYRAKWGLPANYPMVAPAYAELRSQFAKKIGLGRIPNAKKSGRKKKEA